MMRKTKEGCIQEVWWRGHEARFLGVEKQRYKLRWSGNDFGMDGVGTLVKKRAVFEEEVIELCR